MMSKMVDGSNNFRMKLSMSQSHHRDALYTALQGDVAILVGGLHKCRYNTDRDLPFRQESNFLYYTGCSMPDCLAVLDAKHKSFTLFVPRLDAAHAIWVGKIPTNDEILKEHGATKVLYTDEFASFLKTLSGRKAHTVDNLSMKAPADLAAAGLTEVGDLAAISAKQRLYKDEWEVAQIRHACEISRDAFIKVLTTFKAPMHEYEAEALYVGAVMRRGAKFTSFETITASGSHASTLHYVDNKYPTAEHDVLLLDAGCEINGYASDNTRTFPLSRTFLPEQEAIYKTVLRCNKECIAMARHGIKWPDVHLHGLRILLEGLRDLGLVRSEYDFEEQFNLGVPSVFQPHGLGHMMGLDVHDVGAKPSQEELDKTADDKRLKYIRTRVVLEPGMVITVEPGCYFIEGLLEAAKNDPQMAKHFNFDKINKYKKICGGYRIEDDILITDGAPVVMPAAPKELSELYALRMVAHAAK